MTQRHQVKMTQQHLAQMTQQHQAQMTQQHQAQMTQQHQAEHAVSPCAGATPPVTHPSVERGERNSQRGIGAGGRAGGGGIARAVGRGAYLLNIETPERKPYDSTANPTHMMANDAISLSPRARHHGQPTAERQQPGELVNTEGI